MDAFFDIEGTLVQGNTWRTALRDPRLDKWRVRWALGRMIPLWWVTKAKLFPEDVFRQRWVAGMAPIFRGWRSGDIGAIFADAAPKLNYFPDVVARLKQHVQEGRRVVLVSGLFVEGAQAIAQHLGASAGVGTPLEYRDGICTGRIADQCCAGELKLRYAEAQLNEKPRWADGVAYADTASDVPLLSAVGTAVAANPEDALRRIAQERGWQILG
jgi:HAD superfamily hydrolase (TIGR01490 family)